MKDEEGSLPPESFPTRPSPHPETRMSPRAATSPTSPSPTIDGELLSTAFELLHRTNNFLALCMSQAEGALESEDPGELLAALRSIHDGACSMGDYSRSTAARLRNGSAGAPE